MDAETSKRRQDVSLVGVPDKVLGIILHNIGMSNKHFEGKSAMVTRLKTR